MLWWLTDRRPEAFSFAKTYLLTHNAPANQAGDPKGVYSTTVAASGLTSVSTGRAADTVFRAPSRDPHAPDLVGIVQHGVVYTGNVKRSPSTAATIRKTATCRCSSPAPACRPHLSSTRADNPDCADHPPPARPRPR